MASTVFRSVDNKRSVRFSRRETLSWVIPNFLAILTCVSLRACRSSRKLISSAIISAARASTLLRWAGLNFLILSSTFVAMITSSEWGGTVYECPAGRLSKPRRDLTTAIRSGRHPDGIRVELLDSLHIRVARGARTPVRRGVSMPFTARCPQLLLLHQEEVRPLHLARLRLHREVHLEQIEGRPRDDLDLPLAAVVGLEVEDLIAGVLKGTREVAVQRGI